MKKNIFAVLLLGFFVCAYGKGIDKSLEDKVGKCDDPKVLAGLEKTVKGRLFSSFFDYLSKIKVDNGVSLIQKYSKLSENYFNSIKVKAEESSSFKTIELYRSPYGDAVRICEADISVTFPEAPQFLREIQEFRVKSNLIKEFRIKDTATSFNGDTHKFTSIRYFIVQSYNPDLIKQKEPKIELPLGEI